MNRLYHQRQLLPVAAALALIAVLGSGAQESGAESGPDPVIALLQVLSGDQDLEQQAFRDLEQHWRDDLTPMVLDVVHLARGAPARGRLIRLLESRTGQRHGADLDAWYRWLWSREPLEHPRYGNFKSALYGLIDPKFRGYFSAQRRMKIRLDEVRWGGVPQDGIPPLRRPKMIAAKDASYLGDDDVVFGLEVEGDVRAYPKRILAWHKMFVDSVGGVPVAGVYCTLCGTMILFETVHDGLVGGEVVAVGGAFGVVPVVAEVDRRLRNKAEVLALLLDDGGEPLAIAARYLDKHRLYHGRQGGVDFVVLTDRSGANRVYETRGLRFATWDADRAAVDQQGGRWTLHEGRLQSAAGATLMRLPAHRAFWFGWYAAYPETRLVR